MGTNYALRSIQNDTIAVSGSLTERRNERATETQKKPPRIRPAPGLTTQVIAELHRPWETSSTEHKPNILPSRLAGV